jgi:hypothetical protein
MNRLETVARALANDSFDIGGNDKPDARQAFVDRRWVNYIRPAKAVLEALGQPTETSLIAIVVRWAEQIKNGRTVTTVLDAIKSEVVELEEEVGFVGGDAEPGPDGIFGESVDIIAGAIDMIWLVRPNVSATELEIEVATYLDKKCAKWARKVAEGAYD